MILDSLWLFTGASTGVGNSDGKTDSPTTGTQNSSNIIDVGELNGLPASAVGGGGGRDLGIGDDPTLKLMILVTTAFANGTSLQVGVQTAPDAGNNTPSATWTTIQTGPVVAEAQLIAGARLLDVDLARTAPVAPTPPRYYRLTYVTVGTHTAGAIEGLIVLDRWDQPQISNAIASGYPAGITVQN